MRYDVVIIGGGFGGLACGTILSRAGKHVLVLERQAQAGGCVQSYQRGGHSFDTGLHYVGGLAEGQNLHKVFTYLGLMDLPWHRLDPTGFDQVTIGHHTFSYAEGFDAFVDSLAEHFPEEREGLEKYVHVLRHVDNIYFGSLDTMNLSSVNAYDFLCSTFHDPLLINVLSSSAMKMELRRDSLPLFTFAHGNSSFIQSSWRLRGDGNMIVRSLTDSITSNGGAVVCHADVEELIEIDGNIVAARCKNGETYEADLFISDIHPTLTFELVKDSRVLKKVFRRRMNALENTYGMFTVSLVLQAGSLPYFNHNKYVYRKPNVWTFHEDVDGIGGVMVSARVPSNGRYVEQIDLLTPMPWAWCQQWEATHMGHRGEGYTMMKHRMADECLALAEQVIPRLSTMVTERYTSTSLTYRDYNQTPQGSAFGVRKDSHNPLMTMLSPRTPLPNLLLTGQSVMLHGLEGVAMTALRTCSEVIGTEFIETIIKGQRI